MSIINPEKVDYLQARTDDLSFSEPYTNLLRSMASLYPSTEYVDPIPVVREGEGESTLFTTSGIQYLNRFISGDKQYPEHAFVFSQPVIRMNYYGHVALGSYTSFVNFGTMQMGVAYSDHEALIPEYADAIAEHTGQDVQVTDPKEKEYLRDGLEYRSIQSNYVIDGLDVGDSIFHFITHKDGSQITMSELGGGLERAFYRADGSIIAETTDIEEVTEDNVVYADALRGAILMAGNGVIPSNNNQGYQMRRLTKRLTGTPVQAEAALDLLAHPKYAAYEFWHRLGGITVSGALAAETVRNELFRNINITALRDNGLEPKSKMDLTEDPQKFAVRYSLT